MKKIVIILLLLTACTASTIQSTTQPSDLKLPTQAEGGFYQIAEQPTSMQERKPVVLFVGAQFCPFCAAQRWSLVDALNKFGTFEGLGNVKSASGEGELSDIATYDFLRVTYASDWIKFQHVELADRSGNTLDQLNSEQKKYVDTYNNRGSIPFVVIGGMFARVGLGYNPSILQGKTFDEITRELGTDSALSQKVHTDAKTLTNLICQATASKPPTCTA